MTFSKRFNTRHFFVRSTLVLLLGVSFAVAAQNNVVVVPLGGESAKPSIYTEFSVSCQTYDNLDDEGSAALIGEIAKQRENSVLELSWTTNIYLTNISNRNTSRVSIAMQAGGQQASFQTGGVFDLPPSAANNQQNHISSSIYSVHPNIAAGPVFLTYSVETTTPAADANNIVVSGAPCPSSTLIVKEVGG